MRTDKEVLEVFNEFAFYDDPFTERFMEVNQVCDCGSCDKVKFFQDKTWLLEMKYN